MAILMHNTTRRRAERLLANPPDPDFVEPGGGPRAESFSAYLETGPFVLGTPEQYARRKAGGFPAEGGPAILVVDVPDEIIALAVDETYFPLSQHRAVRHRGRPGGTASRLAGPAQADHPGGGNDAMKPEYIERLASAITSPTGAVVGMVDAVLAVCRQFALELDWRVEGCRARAGGEWEEIPGSALRKSVFRAALARFAVLCNERVAESVSPYGGQGEIAVGPAPLAMFRITFTNTTGEQSLRLTGVSPLSSIPAGLIESAAAAARG